MGLSLANESPAARRRMLGSNNEITSALDMARGL
jgi:hypothetical protein